MSPGEAKAKHTATDLIRWAKRFEDEVNEFHREDHMLARVAYEVYELRATLSAIFGSKLPHRKVEDFLPKFTAAVPERPLADLTEEERDEKMKEFVSQSQARWFGALGLDDKGKPKPGLLSEPAPEPPLPARECPSNPQTGGDTGQTPPAVRKRTVITPGG